MSMYECLSTIFVFVLILKLFSILNSCLIISIQFFFALQINFLKLVLCFQEYVTLRTENLYSIFRYILYVCE